MYMKKLLFRVLLVSLFLLIGLQKSSAQKLGISTNLFDWCNMATVNASVNMSMGQHLSAGVSGRYNPWFFRRGTENQVNHALRAVSIDLRYWPWHVYSGWWYMFRWQAQEYNYSNLYGLPYSEQGISRGIGLGTGYALMIGTHWNVDFGVSFWGGMKNYERFDCSYCGDLLVADRCFFFLPDNVFVSFYYIF